MKNSLSMKKLLTTLLTNFLVPFKWTLIKRSLVVKLLIDNIFIERLSFSVVHNSVLLLASEESLNEHNDVKIYLGKIFIFKD